MNFSGKTYTFIAALAVFIGLPLLFYALGEAPRRSILKESFSLITLLAVSLMVGQFFLARSNATLLNLFKPPQIQKVHKYIAYSAVGVIFLHPVLIVLPRYFEGGVKPWDAFLTMITTFDSLGILLGLFAWGAMLVLGVTAYFRKKLIPHFSARYRGWRYFHGGLAVAFIIAALWHAIELGRHTDIAMSAFFVILTLIGFALLAKLYWGAMPKKPHTPPISEGATT
ncbi:Ferric reductase like transmembrane component [Thalassovita gelatinovora]|uniref:Ferric reductase like transmembrane component n=1 Tax=Thalassovita gelatinovora TaxID=53501 RepID=A0A0P1G1C4_THAGE|nr:ferric reductase-like transmembrane domain-containing protein [Thalassovita gelatinovora]QIZ81985.1 FAD/NAD(P)-binding:oxidoreductase [Thalassovita gelatinovora]CUH67425.1 Ferric reductase like transmembrane component [Thalassovita gelatinovora]SEP74278.1 Ferric reductase like transmembrane component [Thalassovita gelatinovora]